MSRKKLFLLDGMALAYRAHFAFIRSNLKNREGLATGPIFGFANTLERLLDSEQPTHVAVAWDTHAPTFRHEWDKAYKANRPPQPDELRVGIPFIKKMITLYGIKNVEKDGFEADDVIGTIAHRAEKKDVDVFMVTPDKDFMQLVDDHIKLYKPLNNGEGFDIVGKEGVESYFGVPPEKVIDVLALIGDASDNISGMPGVGKKTAPKLILEYGSVEGLLESAPKMKKSKLRENLIEHADVARHARKMVVINTDVPDTISWQVMERGELNRPELAAFFQRMNFRTLSHKYGATLDDLPSLPVSGNVGQKSQQDLFDGPAQTLTEDENPYEFIRRDQPLNTLLEALSKADCFAFDTETTGTNPLEAELLGVSLATKKGQAWFIELDPAHHSQDTKRLETLKPFLEDSSKLKIAHHFKYDFLVLGRYGIRVSQPFFDTMIAAYLIDANQSMKMDDLAIKYLQYKPIALNSLLGSGRQKKEMRDIDKVALARYAAEDADVTFQLYEAFKPELEDEDLNRVFTEMELPLIPILAEMEKDGMLLDVALLKELSEDLQSDLEVLENRIYEEADERFNLNSTQQLGVVLFEKLGLPTGRKTATGKYSTKESVLEQLSAQHEVPRLILEYRGLAKLKSTYVDAFPLQVDAKNRIHTSFNQHIAATGRLSSSNPNLQNIPIRTERGRAMRKAFIAEKGHQLLAADYSQIELRVIASISGDENMNQAFVNGEDIHARTAKEVFGLSTLDEVSREHRRKAKEVNFGIPYGVSAYGLAQRLGIDNAEGKAIIEAYFGRFPGIQAYIDQILEFAREHEYVTTIYGRRRFIPDINAGNGNFRAFAERTAINTPIQGSAADLIKLAMIRVNEWLKRESLKTRMVLQVHDELVFEVPDEELDIVKAGLPSLMQTDEHIKVPLKVEIGVGRSWLEAH